MALILGMIVGSGGTALAFCFDEAGAMYGISPQLLWAISKGESDFNPAALNRNTNGTYDFGLMQINSSWAPTLHKKGIPWDALADPCTNVKVGAWLLAQCVRDYGYSWAAVGCYNSRTPSKRDRYAARIARLLSREGATLRQAHRQERLVADAREPLLATPWEEVFGHASR